MTYKEISQKLKISPATLSLVLNNKPGISNTTRQRVLSQIESLGLGYMIKTSSEPRGNLCFLIYKRNGHILDQHPFFLLIMETLEGQAHENGYNILISNIDARNPVPMQIARINEMEIAGTIVFATEMEEEDLTYLQELKRPFVVMDNNFSLSNVNSVAINNEMGTFQAVEHLVRLGHQRIGYLRCTDRISSFVEREIGYSNALCRFGLTLNPLDILDARYSEEGSYLDFKQLFSQPREIPRAFVSDDDTIVSGFVRALNDKGVRVPQDISIVGFNDRPSCELFLPPLTSVDVPKHSFGAEAVDLLTQLINRHKVSGPRNRYGRALKTRICTQLIERQSTRRLSPGEGDTFVIPL